MSKAPRMMKRYKLPPRCDCREVVMRELTHLDDLEASMWADKNATSATAESPVQVMAAEQHEAIRLALVEVDGEPVNVGGVPFRELDGWSVRTMRFLQRAFADLNGVEASELKNFTAGATLVRPGEASAE